MEGRRESIKLSVRNVAKSFTARKTVFEAVKDVSLDVYENEFLVILGPGQCGKSVLLMGLGGVALTAAAIPEKKKI